jgi:protein-S-isoprenylcysteine O-methyltransferase Ste14
MSPGRLLNIVFAVWGCSELVVMVLKHRRSSDARRDRGSIAVLWGSMVFVSIAGSLVKGYRPTRIGAGSIWIGLALVVIGISVRGIAIATLWRYFTYSVSIREGHDLVDRGLYRFIRHPSYTGVLLAFIGLGFARGNWLDVAIIAVGAFAAFSYRIAVEESALIEHFGDRYRDYMRRTKRLIPGIY